jgi:hypothetical protein
MVDGLLQLRPDEVYCGLHPFFNFYFSGLVDIQLGDESILKDFKPLARGSIFLELMLLSNSLRLKEVRQVKSEVNSMLIIFFDIKEFVLADKTINSAYYSDILRRLCENV